MKILRTPDEQFENLPGYSFAPNYVLLSTEGEQELRLHYVDEGPRDGKTVLLMHGEPSWSFLYRKMISGLLKAGCRVIAPDLIGFGRSDKPSERNDYTYQRHVDWMTDCIEQLDITSAVLFCQDWGGLIGLRLVAAFPDRFDGVIAANTGLPTGDIEPSEAFTKWQEFSQTVPVFTVGQILQRGTESELNAEEVAAYDAPYPNEVYKAGARQFPLLVPTTPTNPASEANREAWKILSRFDKPFLTAFSDKDPITADGEKFFHKMVPGCKGQEHVTIANSGHFLQEDKGEDLVKIITQFIKSNNL